MKDCEEGGGCCCEGIGYCRIEGNCEGGKEDYKGGRGCDEGGDCEGGGNKEGGGIMKEEEIEKDGDCCW